MKTIPLLGTVVVLIVLVVAGLLVFRSTAPNGVLTPSPTIATSVVPTQLPITAEPLISTPTPSLAATISPSAQPSQEADEKTTTITITDSGFSPKQLTVVAGTRVTLVNNGQALHWPASDAHPTHELLPGFDAKRGLLTGETYSFTFAKKGTWSYHDHLNPTLTGTITVE